MPSSPYVKTKPYWRDRLRELMAERDIKSRRLAIRAELDAGLVSEWLNPKKLKNPSFDSLVAVAKVLKVSVSEFVEPEEGVTRNDIAPTNLSYAILKGELQAGVWREPRVYAVSDDALVPIVPHPDFLGIQQYAWKVVGNSMNLLAKPGTYVVGVSFYDTGKGRRLRDGDVVVCERKDGEKIECTLKRVVKDSQGFRLQAESDDPSYDESFWLSSEEDGEETSVRATHLVIGLFSFLA